MCRPNRRIAQLSLPLSIAVSQTYRGQGVAERLYRKLQEYIRDNGIDQFRITVGIGPATAHRFYRKIGAIPVSELEVHTGEQSIVYVDRLA